MLTIRSSLVDVKVPCRFCDLQLHGDGGVAYNQKLLESGNYFAIASIGGFIPGWTLIVPKTHKLNLADDFRSPEFREFLVHTEQVVREEFGRPVVFEHGANADNSLVACGTNHAHLHLVPFSESLTSAVREFDESSIWELCRPIDVSNIVGCNEYLLMADSLANFENGHAFVSRIAVPQSQYFRKVLARAVGLEGMSNYKVSPFEELSSETASRFSSRASDIFGTDDLASHHVGIHA